MIIICITILLFTVYAAIILYYRQSWLQIPPFEVTTTNNDLKTTISVIIPARNEEKNIAKCIESIIKQSYPDHLYEIIVVDDFSTDNTAEIVRSYARENIILLSLNNFIKEKVNSYKKKAIEIAIAQAKGELVVTTDADCVTQVEWLQTIASAYELNQPAFIAAPVKYSPENNFLAIFQSLDFITLQGITGAAVHKKFHMMCNGANLAYEKKAFFQVNGFTGIDTIASGDDMFLMHKIYEKYPNRIMFLKSPDAIVETKAMNSINDFFNQRIRWASKSDKYADKKISAVLLTVYLFNAWIVLLGLLCFFYTSMITWFISVLLLKTIIEIFFLYPVAKFFGKQKLLWWFPAAQPFHILYIIIAGWLGKFGSYKWKGRRVK